MALLKLTSAGPDELFKFVKEMQIPVSVLPLDPQCLFKNTEDAEMWRHIITTIRPAHKIQLARKQIIASKILKYENGGDEPAEIARWRRSRDMTNKVESLKELLLKTRENLQDKITKLKINEQLHDELKNKNELLNLKKKAYKKKKIHIQQEIEELKKYQNVFGIFVQKSMLSHNSLDENFNILFDKVKEFIGKNNKYEEFKPILEKILFNTPKKDIWEYLYNFLNKTFNKLQVLVENINHDEDAELLSKVGTTIRFSVAKLSAEHIKLHLNIVKNSTEMKNHQKSYVSFLNQLKETGASIEDINNLDCVFQKNIRNIKVGMYKDRLSTLNLKSSDLASYENKNIELLQYIKEIDFNMKFTIRNIEQYDHILSNEPQKINDVLNNNYEIIDCFKFYLKNNPYVSISYKDDLEELDIFANMDLSQTPALIQQQNRTCLENQTYNVSNNYSNLLEWESIPFLILNTLSNLKEFVFYKSKNNITLNHKIPNVENNLQNYSNYNDKIKSIEHLQSKIYHKLEYVQKLIEFWDKNKLKDYISPDRLVDNKPYKYYEDLLLEYKKML